MTALPDAVLQLVVGALPGAILIKKQDDTSYSADDLVVFDGIIPKAPPNRYAVVYIDDGTLDAIAACNQHDSAKTRWQVTSVAPDRERASWIATKIRENTVDTTPAAAGWACGRVCHDFSERPSRDETVAERPVVFKIDLYDLLATRV